MVSRLTPLVNVDLIIYSSENEFYLLGGMINMLEKVGISGGIIRYKEDMLVESICS